MKLLPLLALLAAGLVSTPARAPSATSAGGLLVFVCATCPGAETGERLFTIRPDGSGLRMLPTAERASEPRWSPDGRRLAYARIDGFLATSRADGSRERALTHPIRGAQDSSPAWSPDGTKLVYVRVAANPAGGDPRTVLRTIRANGRKPRFLLSAPVNVVWPDWSPDGRSIAFNDIRERLWTADADGSHRRRLGGAKLAGRLPRWSPDGRRMAFVDIDSGVVRTLDVRTGRVRTVFKPEYETYDVEYFDWAHAWSPDGRRLAVLRTAAVECVDDPTTDWCEQAQLSIVDLANGRSALIYRGPLASTTEGLDWRR